MDEAARKAKAAVDGPEGDELRDAELATRATSPGMQRPSNPDRPIRKNVRDEQGFQEPDEMKDDSEDRE